MSNTTKVVSLNPVHGKVYLIQHYVIKFVSNLRQIGGFLWDSGFSEKNPFYSVEIHEIHGSHNMLGVLT
jgi:hypothetical protein